MSFDDRLLHTLVVKRGAPVLEPCFLSAVLADAPIAYWRLGEPSGTNANDETANNRDGTYNDAPTLGVASALSGDANTAVTLNGTSENITVADSSPFRFAGTAAFSVEVWFKHTPDATYRRIVECDDSTYGWAIFSQDAGFGFQRRTAAAWDEAPTSAIGPVSSGVWHHAVATYDGTTMLLYLDGIEYGDNTSAASLPSDTTFRIGGHAAVGWFNGSLDEVAIYDRALSAAEVSEHYDAASVTCGDLVLDEYSQPTFAPETVDTIRGLIQPRTAREVEQADQAGAVIGSHVGYIRPLAGLTTADWIELAAPADMAGRYDILAVPNAAGLSHHLELALQAVT